MASFNMPPGVSVNDIPGNRPEDLAYEAFWERLSAKFPDIYPTPDNANMPESQFIDLVDWVAGEAYKDGYNAGMADEALAEFYRHEEDN